MCVCVCLRVSQHRANDSRVSVVPGVVTDRTPNIVKTNFDASLIQIFATDNSDVLLSHWNG